MLVRLHLYEYLSKPIEITSGLFQNSQTHICVYPYTNYCTLPVQGQSVLQHSSKTHKHTHTHTHTHTYVCVPINYCPLPVQRQSVLQHLCSAHSLQNTTFPHNNSTLLHLTDTHKAHKHSNTGSHHNCSGTPMRRRYCYHQSQHQLLCISQGVGP